MRHALCCIIFMLYKKSIRRRGIMYKKLLVFCFVMSLAGPAHAYKVKQFQPLAPQMQAISPLADPYQQAVGVNESYPKITQLEENIFRRNYEKENIYSRLTRLENRVFRRSFTGMPLATRVDNLLANIDAGIMYGISSKEIAKLEMKVLGRTYTNDDTESRITRLEKEMLGAMQGGNLKERYETVKTASKHYNSYPELAQSQVVYPQRTAYGYNPYNGYYPNTARRYSNTTGGVSGLLQNIAGRIFGDFGPGTLTGYTAPIYDPYNPYGFNNSGMGQQDYNFGNRGGYMRNRNIGNGGSIRILD